MAHSETRDTAAATALMNLSGIARQVRQVLTWRRLQLAAWALLALALLLLLALLLADAAWALPSALRRFVLPLYLIILAAAPVVAVWAIWRCQPDRDRSLTLAEQACGDRHRTLTVAAQLSAMDGELAAAGAAQAQHSLPLGGLVAGLPQGDRRPWWGLLAAVLATLIAVQLLAPGLWSTCWHRLSDPLGDHPPFSFTALTWAETPQRVRVGDPARFEVTIDGPHNQVLLLAGPQADEPTVQVPMFRIGGQRYAGEVAAVDQPLTVWVAAGGTRTRRHQLAVDPKPELRGLTSRLRAPAYAGLDDEVRRWRRGHQQHFEALSGSELELVPTSNRNLVAVQARCDDGPWRRLPLVAGVASLADPEPGTWAIRLLADDGVVGDAEPVVAIDRREDRPPRARISHPSRRAAATPTMTVPFAQAAEDDLGLSATIHQFVYNRLAEPDRRRSVSGRSWSQQGQIDLGDLGVVPGDVLGWSLVARDTRPDGGQLSELAEGSLHIISEEAYNQQLRRRIRSDFLSGKYNQVLREMRQLAEEIDRAAARPRDQQSTSSKEALAKRAEDLAARIAAMKRKHPLFAIESEIQRNLLDQAQKLAAAARAGKPAGNASAAAEMMQQDLALITALARAQGHLGRLRQLIDAEQNTAERFLPLADHRRLGDTDRVRLRELGGQEDTLAEALEEWLRQTAKQAEALREFERERDAGLLEGLAEALAESEAAKLKQQAAQAARAGDANEAQRLAQAARDALLALLPATQRCQSQCEGGCFGLSWCNSSAALDAVRGLGLGYGGYGLGGVGSAGLGVALGYGGDDTAGTAFSDAMDLYGPESFSAGGQRQGEGQGDGIAEMAAAGEGVFHRGAAHRQVRAGGRAAATTPLGRRLQEQVDRYHSVLDKEVRP